MIIAPKVPPRANAYIPRKMKTNINIRIIARKIKDIVSRAGEIPRKSRAIFVFLDYKYSIAFSTIFKEIDYFSKLL